jgi:hypothetical protein
MKVSTLSLLALLIASPLAAQTPVRFPARVGQALTISSPYMHLNNDGLVSGFRLKLTDKNGVTKQWGTDYLPANVWTTDTVTIETSYPTTGTFDVQLCVFGTIFNDVTLQDETKENCTDRGLVELVFNRNSFDKPTTITITASPRVGVSTTSGPSGTTTTTTAPK